MVQVSREMIEASDENIKEVWALPNNNSNNNADEDKNDSCADAVTSHDQPDGEQDISVRSEGLSELSLNSFDFFRSQVEEINSDHFKPTPKLPTNFISKLRKVARRRVNFCLAGTSLEAGTKLYGWEIGQIRAQASKVVNTVTGSMNEDLAEADNNLVVRRRSRVCLKNCLATDPRTLVGKVPTNRATDLLLDLSSTTSITNQSALLLAVLPTKPDGTKMIDPTESLNFAALPSLEQELRTFHFAGIETLAESSFASFRDFKFGDRDLTLNPTDDSYDAGHDYEIECDFLFDQNQSICSMPSISDAANVTVLNNSLNSNIVAVDPNASLDHLRFSIVADISSKIVEDTRGPKQSAKAKSKPKKITRRDIQVDENAYTTKVPAKCFKTSNSIDSNASITSSDSCSRPEKARKRLKSVKSMDIDPNSLAFDPSSLTKAFTEVQEEDKFSIPQPCEPSLKRSHSSMEDDDDDDDDGPEEASAIGDGGDNNFADFDDHVGQMEVDFITPNCYTEFQPNELANRSIDSLDVSYTEDIQYTKFDIRKEKANIMKMVRNKEAPAQSIMVRMTTVHGDDLC